MRHIFLKKSYTTCGGEAIPKLFYKKLKLSISLDQHFEMLSSLFLFCVQVEVYKNIFKSRCRSLAFTLYKAFFCFFYKARPGASLASLFSALFSKENICHVMFFN